MLFLLVLMSASAACETQVWCHQIKVITVKRSKLTITFFKIVVDLLDFVVIKVLFKAISGKFIWIILAKYVPYRIYETWNFISVNLICFGTFWHKKNWWHDLLRMRKHAFLDQMWNLQTRISGWKWSCCFTGSRHAITLKLPLGSLLHQRSWFITSSAIFCWCQQKWLLVCKINTSHVTWLMTLSINFFYQGVFQVLVSTS